MNSLNVIVVRIYITESSHLLKKIMNYLSNEVKVRGVTVFRAIQGAGESGSHTTSFLDLSLDLPLTIEFFDEKERVLLALEHLNTLVNPEHIIFWEAKTNA